MNLLCPPLGIIVFVLTDLQQNLHRFEQLLLRYSNDMDNDQNKLTPWAIRYGAMPNSHKSGFTLIDYSSFLGAISSTKQHENDESEIFQRDRLFGMTTRELDQLDALFTRDLMSGVLSNIPIVPFLQRRHWEKSPSSDFSRSDLYPVEGGSGGFWIADNDDIWTILDPCVRIASRILMSGNLLPWVRGNVLRSVYLLIMPLVWGPSSRRSAGDS